MKTDTFGRKFAHLLVSTQQNSCSVQTWQTILIRRLLMVANIEEGLVAYNSWICMWMYICRNYLQFPLFTSIFQNVLTTYILMYFSNYHQLFLQILIKKNRTGLLFCRLLISTREYMYSYKSNIGCSIPHSHRTANFVLENTVKF